ncbi:uncharacterized protein LOC108910870 [Anoplophora glabripennis]|uniref:uncharacterized protein LOC108910870 n=1 Tax=Anoplophora glabripennis TaxID=217634 RepID=UPI00087420D3|nr:uncharacterized protein LOC108910870 [Anoplophora glabripennis]
MKNNTRGLPANLNISCTANRKYTIERVEQVEYLGVTLTCKGDEEKEIEKRLAKGSVPSNIKAYSYLCMRDVDNEKKRGKQARSLGTKIFGGIKVQNEFRRRTNKEIEELYKNPNIVQVVKMQRARWLGHIARMSGERWVKRILIQGEGGKRRRGRPRKRWLEEVTKDVRDVGVRDWKEEALDRKRWERRVKDLIAKGR